ncbi:amidohydrolase [Isobaculum melis]|uniref:Amidohydrolase n=1 Tax=Isobaculum melis TaxID=142588 RepID=A0A1H9UGA0_9LACT|nr:amidohydrolase [Isobaculum melis]SES08291.1 amidohydrolase [Isobaculum melis]
MTYQTWQEELAKNYEETVAWRRYLHEHPEPSFEETETAKYIVARLKEFGITDIEEQVGGNGIVAKIKGAQPGPTVALRADFDALRIQEENDVPYASKVPGIMHACGHDAHTATLLSVAKVLQNHTADLKGTVVLIHQHAEEVLPGGAKSMVEAGCLEGVDVVFGIHVSSALEVGHVAYTNGYAMAAADFFEMKLQGKGGHGASPHTTVDAVVVGSQIVAQAQTLVSRLVDPVKPAVVTFSAFQAGGEACNIIADKAELRGTVRTYQPEVRDLIEENLEHLAKSVAGAYHATIDFDYTRGYPAVYNHPAETERVVSLMKETFGEAAVVEVDAAMGGEDFAYYVEKKPGTFFYVGAGNQKEGITYPHHHPKFNVDENCMLQAGEAFLAICADYLA